MRLFERLRPKGATAAALAEAIDRTAAALAEAEARLADLQGRRGAALLAGGSMAEKHEAALREARDEADQLTALRDALCQSHAEAEAREQRQRLEAMAAEAERAAKASGERIAREYPKLAGQMAALFESERAALAAIAVLVTEIERAGADAAEGIAIPRHPLAHYGAPGARSPMSEAVRLPRHDTLDPNWHTAACWWPEAS